MFENKYINKCIITTTTTTDGNNDIDNSNINNAMFAVLPSVVLTAVVDDGSVLPSATLIDSRTNTGDEFHASTCLAVNQHTHSHTRVAG